MPNTAPEPEYDYDDDPEPVVDPEPVFKPDRTLAERIKFFALHGKLKALADNPAATVAERANAKDKADKLAAKFFCF